MGKHETRYARVERDNYPTRQPWVVPALGEHLNGILALLLPADFDSVKTRARYFAALDGRAPELVSAFDLLPAIYAAVPDIRTTEIVAALRRSARKDLRAADPLERTRKLKRPRRESDAAGGQMELSSKIRAGL